MSLEGAGAQCVAASGPRVLVGTRGQGAFLSVDGGEGWEQIELPERDVFSVAIGAADGALYAGTEPSRIFVARDGANWREFPLSRTSPRAANGAFRRAHGRTTCAGSLPTRTAGSGCWSGSSSEASCTPTTAG